MDMDSNDYKIARPRRKLIIAEKFSNKTKKGACRKLSLCTSIIFVFSSKSVSSIDILIVIVSSSLLQVTMRSTKVMHIKGKFSNQMRVTCIVYNYRLWKFRL